MMKLSDIEKTRFEQWVKENVTEQVVPSDEGNSNALIYNLVHLIRGDKDHYCYGKKQDEEIKSWRI